MHKAIFLDRDGTINVEVHYLHEPKKFQFIPKVPEALKRLQDAGFKLIIITNQGAIGKGIYRVEDMHKTNDYMIQQLKNHGVVLDGIYFCPHQKEEGCRCRKPQPGMILQAIKDLQLNPSQSWMIGDKLSDLEAGRRASTRTMLVLTGYGESQWKLLLEQEAHHFPMFRPDTTARSLWEATDIILA